jgi:hypothetical protein
MTQLLSSRCSYENSFAIRKDADPDIPILKQALTELLESGKAECPC